MGVSLVTEPAFEPAAAPMDAATLAHVAQWLLAARRAESVRLTEIHRYIHNRIIDIYVPKSATAEYRALVDQSRFNVLPLVVKAVAQNLFVEGYRPARQADNAPVWDGAWQPNRMDARQAGIYRAALTYGVSYALVLPGRLADRPVPVIRPYSPRRLTALYADPIGDEWPRYALAVGIPRPAITADTTQAGGAADRMVTEICVYDAHHEYSLDVPAALVTPPTVGTFSAAIDPAAFEGLAFDPTQVRVRAHGLGVCPAVRFVDSYEDLDDGPEGIVYPMLAAQRQLNQTTFGLRMAEQYAAFRQRWATGMAIAEDQDGNPIEPWNAAVNRVWQNESPDGRFGDFEQTDLSGYLDSRDKTLLYVASARQIPPHTLVVGNAVSNVSAEALAALEAGHRQDIAEHQTSFGESAEQMLRLAGLAMGDRATWEDTSAQVRWRDTTPRSLGQVADALGKMAAQLGIPPRALWERLPDVTDQDIERWQQLADDTQILGELTSMLGDQAATPQQQQEGVDDAGATGQSDHPPAPA
jgi:hypothetical protein